MGKVGTWALAGLLGFIVGCSATPEQCDDNVEACEQDCAFEDGLAAQARCLSACDEEYNECLDAAEDAEEGGEVALAILEALFSGDDDDDC